MNWLLYGTVALLSLVALIFTWLMYSESGANWLWARATAALPDQLSAERVEGSLRRGLRLTGLRYQDTTTDLRIGSVEVVLNPDLVPTAINVEGLRVDDLLLELKAVDAEPAAPLNIEELLAGLELPFLLRLRDTEISNAAIVDAEGTELLALDTLQLQAEMRRSIEVSSLRLQAGELAAGMQAKLDLYAPHALVLSADARGPLPASISPDAGVQTVTVEADGNLRKLAVKINSESQQLDVTGSIDDIAGEMRVDLAARAPELRWPLSATDPQVLLQDVILTVAGTLQDYQFELQTVASAAGIEGVSANGRGSGDPGSLRIDSLELASAALQAGLTGELNWLDEFSVSAALDLRHLDPAHWDTGWPQDQPLRGEVAAGFSGTRLELANVNISQANAAARVSGGGVIDLDGGVVDLRLTTESLQWPVAPAAADVSSPRASLVVTGSPDDWQVAGDVALQSVEFPEGRLAINGGGNRESLRLRITEGQVLGGGIEGNVAYDWSSSGSWQAALAFVNARTGGLLPAWPGRLNARIETSGSLEPLVADLNILSLDGELRARPVSASGRVQIAAGSVTVNDLQLQSAGSSLTLDGAVAGNEGLSFELDVESLTDFVPGAAGRLQASGNVRENPQVPLLVLQLEGSDLSWAGVSAATLTMSNEATAEYPFDLKIGATEVTQGDVLIDNISATLSGSEASHRMEASAAGGGRQLQAALSGALQRHSDIAQSAWQGNIESLLLAVSEDTEATLREQAPLSATTSAIDLGQFCLDVSSGGAVCGEGNWRESGRYAATLDMHALPLDLLRFAGVTDLVFTQALDGSMTIGAGNNGKLSANGRIDISPGEIQNSYDERLTLTTRAGFAALNLEDGQLLAGEISLPFSEAAEIRGEFRVIDVAAGTASAITGNLVANVRNIGVAAQIIPQIDAARGALNADLRVAGTLAAPEFSGEMTLRDGYFAYDPLGFKLADVQLASRILPGNRLEVESTFSSGEGSARLTSSADYLQGRSAGLELTLKGEKLRLLDLPELRAEVNPDLQFGLRDNDFTINGRLGIESARLASINFIAGGVNESDDVVLVGEQQSEDSAAASESALNFGGSVTLDLGSNIVIDLDVAEARLQGQSEFRWNGPALPVANGGFELTGKFEAYGQLLEITEGAIRFPNVPADSPLLRIRAEREIFGNSQIRRAGVMVSGTAMQPEVSVYTNPATTQDRALTLLITGSDFDFEQGVGAVDVGTYIAPKLYASYGIGLFDKENVISVRYDLTKSFGIKATSGRSAAGIDISYTISR